MSFPGAIASFAGFTSSHTLAADSHASQHNSEQAEIVAVETKVGTGASTPVNNTVLRGNGTGTSVWAQVALTTDVTGVLPIANGGTGQTSLSSLTLPTAILSNPAISGTVSGSATYTTPVLSTPTVADFTNANHTHASANQGGSLNGANAITDGTLTPAELTSGTGSSWAWQSWTPTLSGLFDDTKWTKVCTYIQTGKTVHFKLQLTASTTTPMSGSSNAIFTLPITSIAYTTNTDSALTIGTGGCTDDSANIAIFTTADWLSTTTSRLMIHGAGGTYVGVDPITATAPFVWTTSDEITIIGKYEAA